MRVAILGGSFNPPHVGHLALARAAREALALEEVLLVPAARPPHKPGHPELVSPAHRLAMTRLAAAEQGFAVSDLELRREGPSYTVDTLRELQRARPEAELFFVVGADTVGELPTWKEAGALLREATFVAVNRPGYPLDEGLAAVRAALGEEAAASIRVVAMPPEPASATQLRARCRAGQGPGAAVPAAVAQYIREHGLYRGEFHGDGDDGPQTG